jgi:hypothetical protein
MISMLHHALLSSDLFVEIQGWHHVTTHRTDSKGRHHTTRRRVTDFQYFRPAAQPLQHCD